MKNKKPGGVQAPGNKLFTRWNANLTNSQRSPIQKQHLF